MNGVGGGAGLSVAKGPGIIGRPEAEVGEGHRQGRPTGPGRGGKAREWTRTQSAAIHAGLGLEGQL